MTSGLSYPNILARLCRPLAVARVKLDAVLAAVGPRLGLAVPVLALDPGDTMPGDGHGEERAEQGITVIRVVGSLVHRTTGMEMLSGCVSYESIGAQLAEAVEDPTVGGILLDVDSYGGEAAGMVELARRIREARRQKPVYAVVNEAALSAGYGIASAASRVYAPQGALVGSIGVYLLHVDASAQDEQDGRAYTFIHAGAKKVHGNQHEPLADEARADLQREVDATYELFVQAVVAGRGISADAVRNTEAGVLSAEDGLRLGLVDHIGGIETAIAGLQEQVGRRPPALGDTMADKKKGKKPGASQVAPAQDDHHEPGVADLARGVVVCSTGQPPGFLPPGPAAEAGQVGPLPVRLVSQTSGVLVDAQIPIPEPTTATISRAEHLAEVTSLRARVAELEAELTQLRQEAEQRKQESITAYLTKLAEESSAAGAAIDAQALLKIEELFTAGHETIAHTLGDTLLAQAKAAGKGSFKRAPGPTQALAPPPPKKGIAGGDLLEAAGYTKQTNEAGEVVGYTAPAR